LVDPVRAIQWTDNNINAFSVSAGGSSSPETLSQPYRLLARKGASIKARIPVVVGV